MPPQEHRGGQFRCQVGGELRGVDLVVEDALGSVHGRDGTGAAACWLPSVANERRPLGSRLHSRSQRPTCRRLQGGLHEGEQALYYRVSRSTSSRRRAEKASRATWAS